MIAFVIGTRPEAIKAAPVLAEFARRGVETVAYTTGQHVAARVVAAARFVPGASGQRWVHAGEIVASSPRSRLGETVGWSAGWLSESFSYDLPRAVVVTGDTASALGGAIAAHGARIPLVHLEAGLRSGDERDPFPEESYRVAIDSLSDLLLCPTERARSNLLSERNRRQAGKWIVTTNTVVDAVRIATGGETVDGVAPSVPRHQYALVTLHRRESWDRVADVAAGLDVALATNPAWTATWVQHPNPDLAAEVSRRAGAMAASRRVSLVPAVDDYQQFLRLVRYAGIVLTDSGGLQEETACFGVPTVVARACTERPEGVDAGLAVCAGLDPTRILAACRGAMARFPDRVELRQNPYGDGYAASRVCDAIQLLLG